MPVSTTWKRRAPRPSTVRASRHALDRYAETRGLTIDLEQLNPIPDTDLVNFLGVAMPFHPSEKQAILEAGSIGEREKILVSLLEFGGETSAPPSDAGSRTLN